MSDTKLEKLKRDIQKELQSENIDFDRIGELSEALISLDPNALRFSVDAKHVHRLGFELVGKQETALSELIKNAYDADSTEVIVQFDNYEEAGGTLVIEDDGHGMTEETIRNTWMRLSTGDKENNPLSPQFDRKRAGKKGIGRFAVERLGKQLILETLVKGETSGIRVVFDWDTMYQHGKALAHIPNRLERFPKNIEDQGTRLRINDLRDRWTAKRFEQVWKSVLLLQPPFKTSKTEAAGKRHKLDPGFKVVINGRSDGEKREELSIESQFLEHRTALISCTLDESGHAHFEVNSEPLSFKDSLIDTEHKYDLVGPLNFELNYFIYLSSVMSGVSVKKAMAISNEYGGVRIYRDGFRVMPYGERYDDWLKLGVDSGNRSLLTPANNYNFFGHIDISSTENVLFEETASREGFIENEAFDQLQVLVRRCIEWATIRIGSVRNRKTSATQKGFVSEVRKPSESTQHIIDELKEEARSSDFGSEEKEDLIEILEYKKKEEQEYEEFNKRREAEHAQYEEMLRILASLGISIAVFGHEVRGSLSRVRASVSSLESSLSSYPEDEKISSALQEAKEATSGLYELSQYIVELMGYSNSRAKKPIALFGAIERFITHFKDYLDAKGIEFELNVEPKGIRTEPMHPSEIDSVLFNFLTNAVKSMERSNSRHRKIRIQVQRENDLALLSFQDTGGGVAQDIVDRIFDPFFTTANYEADAVTGPGSGLGLKIVSDIASANGGEVKLREPDQGYACKFEFSVPVIKSQRN